MKVIYMAHPVSGDVAQNLEHAREWYAYFIRNYDVAIIADWIITCMVLDDDNPDDRARGLAADLAAIPRVDELWLCGPHISSGMLKEAQMAHAEGIVVRNLTFSSKPPHEPVDIESYPVWTP